MNGIAGGLLTWGFVTGPIMIALCFLISLITRHFLTGGTLVLVTTSLTLLVALIGVAVGMAWTDFTLEVVLPYAVLAIVIGAVWLLGMKARAHSG